MPIDQWLPTIIDQVLVHFWPVAGTWVAAVVVPFLTGFIKQLFADYARNKMMADAGAAQQRAVNDSAETAAEANAAKVTANVDAMSPAAVADALANRLRHA